MGKAERASEATYAKSKRDANAVERVRLWAKIETKEKDKIARITAEAGGRDNAEAAERGRAWSEAKEGKGGDRQGSCSG